LYIHFKPEIFDDAEDYEKQWTRKYNKEKVENKFKKTKKMVIYFLLHQF
jgi:hypothetical protein